jgi:hypothetical protein
MVKAVQRTKPCSAAVRAGRLAKARQFWDAADILHTLVDDDQPANGVARAAR